MSIKDKYSVRSIETYLTKEWLLHKHYAKRMCSISYAFGLFKENILVGVCTYGMPPNYMEMMAWKPYDLLELNRLVVDDNLDKNTLSFFVSTTIKNLPKPKVLISYSDFSMGHYGYIYQATNWYYTGIGSVGEKIFYLKDGTDRHQRHKSKIDLSLIDRIEKTIGKARYYFFIGNKYEKNKMKELLRYDVLPYPKGDNKRYDASFKPTTQIELF